MSEAEEETVLTEAIQLRTVLRRPPDSLPLRLPPNGLPPDPYKSPDSPLPPPPPHPNHHSIDADETDEEVLEYLSRGPLVVKTESPVRPSKSQVLYYLSAASAFRLKRVGTDLQVCDNDDFPLLDVWVEMDCCRCTWVVEAYGRVVLLLHEKAGRPAQPCCARSRPPITVTDWNGDTFGFLVPGDPFLLQNPERRTVAKLVPHSPATSSSGVSSQGDPRLGDGAESSTEASTRMLPEKRLCWLAVLEGSGRHVARLEDFDTLLFHKDVAFQLKLLTLAGILRLSGPWMLPGRGDGRHLMGPFGRAVSALLNCCAYCFY